MVKDVNLRIANAVSLTTVTGPFGDTKDTEGGMYALAHFTCGLIGGTTPLYDFVIEASINGGSNYYEICRFPQFDTSDDNMDISRPCYIPRPASGQTVTKVRANLKAQSGTTPTIATITIYLEPMVGAAPPAIDEVIPQGVAYLT